MSSSIFASIGVILVGILVFVYGLSIIGANQLGGLIVLLIGAGVIATGGIMMYKS